MYTTPEMESTLRVSPAGALQTDGMLGQASIASQSAATMAVPSVTRPTQSRVSNTNVPHISVTMDMAQGTFAGLSLNRPDHQTSQGVGDLDYLVRVLCDNFTYERERVGMLQDPMAWTKSEVQIWLSWAIHEFHLEHVDRAKFLLDGRSLCAMSQQEFLSRTPQYMGDILYAHIQHLRAAALPASQPSSGADEIDQLVQSLAPEIVSSSHTQNSHLQLPQTYYSPDTPPKSPSNGELLQYDGSLSPSTTRTTLIPPPYRQAPSPSSSATSCHSALTSPHVSPCASPAPPGPSLSIQAAMTAAYTESSGPIQLWQFLLELLTDKKNMDCIVWTGREWEFKLTDPELVAQRWGKRKKKPKMNYEKLSRGLRYYYDKNIIHKVPGKRYVYKFVCDLESLLGCSAAELQARYHSEVPSTLPQQQLQQQLQQQSLPAYTYTTSLPSIPASNQYTPYWQPSGLSTSIPATYYA